MNRPDLPELAAPLRRFKPYPTYKDSGMEWLGKTPAHWVVAPVYARYEVALGKMLDAKQFTGQFSGRYLRNVDVQWNAVNVNALPEMDFAPWERDRYLLRPGDLLVCEGGEVGRTAVWIGALEECFYQKAIHRVRPRSESEEPRFFYFLMYALAKRGVFTAGGNPNTIDHLTAVQLRHYRMPFPSIPEQRAIAAFLDRETARIDDLIAQKERLIDLLQEKRTALITRAVTKGLNLSAPMKDSGVEWLGEIPAHWVVERNRWLFRESDRRSESGEEELLTVSHITGVTRRSEKPEVTMIEAESHEGYKLCRAGELAINTMWAWMGALGIAREDGMVSPSYNVFSIRDPRLTPAYYDFLCRIPLHVAEIIRHSKGIWQSRLRLYPDAFLEISTPLPPAPEQQAIATALQTRRRELDALTAEITKAIERLKELRTALVSDAVTGKIDVREEVQ